MTHQHVKMFLLVTVMLAWSATLAVADTLVLKDGSKIVGSVMKSGDRYNISPDDGSKAKWIEAGDVKDWIKSAGTPTSGGGATATPTPGGTAPSALYVVARTKAEALVYPTDAIKVWKDYIAGKPAPNDNDKKNAEAQIADLTKLLESGSERINGKWVSGVERKKMATDATAVYKDSIELFNQDKTLQALDKLQEVLKVYPNHYNANCLMAYFSYKQNTDPTKYVELCLRLRPTAIDALNNKGVMLAKVNQLEAAVEKFYEAVQIEDDPYLVFNLTKAVTANPNKNSPVMIKALEASKLLMAKYRDEIPPFTASEWGQVKYIMHPPVPPQRASQGMLVSGSGFVLNKDGYIITNRHVVSKMTSFLIITADGKSLSAELVTVDADRDLAILKIKKMEPGVTLTPVVISAMSFPTEGQRCYAIGYPLMDVLGASIKITEGIISGKAPKGEPGGVDVIVTAKVNPGNSGGPLLDNHGQVIALVTMKTYNDATEDSYGMAISAGTLKKFLAENKITIDSAEAGEALEPQDVMKKVRAGTVCILATDGEALKAKPAVAGQ